MSPLDFARRLVDMGVPVFAAQPDPDGRTASGRATGYTLPSNWQRFTADPKRLDVWREGWALCAIGGHGLDFIDVDPRNGGHDAARELRAAGTWPREYAVVTTPSGGGHFYVASLGISKTKRSGIDLQSGSADGPETGRGFVFLPGTIRSSKATGRPEPYLLLVDALDTFGQDDTTGGPFRAWVSAARAPDASSSAPAGVAGTPIPAGTQDDTLSTYAATMAARGLDFETVVALVIRRGQDCDPPWHAGMKPGDETLEEAARTRWVPSAMKKFSREWVDLDAGVWPAFDAAVGELTAAAEPAGPHRTGGRRLKVVRASEMRQKSTRWLWEQSGSKWVPLGGLVLLGGREGVGKSTWAYRLAAQVTRGTLPGDLFGEPRSVIVAATEDAWEQTILPRCVAAGVDAKRILRVDAETPEGATTGLVLPTDNVALTQLCEQEEVALVLLDPLLGTVSGKLDTHKDAEVRQMLEPLSRLAHDCQLSIIGLIHQNKGSGDLLTKLMGSRAFAAVARAVIVCAEEKSELQEGDFGDAVDASKGARRTFLFGQEKNNLAARVEHSIRYSIEGANTGYDYDLNKAVWSSRIEVREECNERVGEMVERQERDSKGERGRPVARKEAESWLRKCLADAGEAVPSTQVYALAKAAGHSTATVSRAAKEIEVRIIRMPDMSTVWQLAEVV